MVTCTYVLCSQKATSFKIVISFSVQLSLCKQSSLEGLLVFKIDNHYLIIWITYLESGRTIHFNRQLSVYQNVTDIHTRKSLSCCTGKSII